MLYITFTLQRVINKLLGGKEIVFTLSKEAGLRTLSFLKLLVKKDLRHFYS